MTTTPGAATQPLPEIPSPHAVPRTRTTLAAAARTSGSRAIWLVGAAGIGGPAIDGNGSTRASAFSSRSGGTISFSRCSTSERCTSWRSERWPGSRSATAPTIQTSAIPAAAPRTRPPAVSSARSGGKRIAARKNEPAIEPSASSTAAPITAPARATSGAYGECAPPLSTTGAIRAPITAPATMPVIASRLATSPFRSPTKPPSATTASAIQSSRPTWAG